MPIREFPQRKVQPAWVYRADGAVWRVVPTGAGVFVGEDRNIKEKRVSFFCTNQVTGEVLWKGVSFDERWWIGIEAIHSDRVFLHGFSRPDMPDHKKILALDLFTGRTAWSNDDMRFILAVGDSVFASKDTVNGRMIFELNLRTGSTLRSLENDPDVLNTAKSRMLAMTNNDTDFPLPLDEPLLMNEPRIALVYKHCQKDDVVGAIEVVDRDNLLFFTHHVKNDLDGRLRKILKIVDRNDGELLFAETLDRNLQNTVPDLFFLRDNMLYFVKDQSTLIAVNIDDLKR